MPELRPYRHILALVDFDAGDAEVVGKATLLARMNGATLDILHLIEPDSQLDGGYPGGSPNGYETAALRRLNFLAASFGADKASCHAVYGPRSRSLARHVAHAYPDLIVTGEAPAWLAGVCDTLILLPRPRPRTRGGRLLRALGTWLGWRTGAA
ncbi:MAG: universal stress protein [Pseudomonadota bacterium]